MRTSHAVCISLGLAAALVALALHESLGSTNGAYQSSRETSVSEPLGSSLTGTSGSAEGTSIGQSSVGPDQVSLMRDNRLPADRTKRPRREQTYETLGPLPPEEIARVQQSIKDLVSERLQAANALSDALPDTPSLQAYGATMDAWAAYHQALAIESTFAAGEYECVDMRFLTQPRPGKTHVSAFALSGHVIGEHGSRRPVLVYIDIDYGKHQSALEFRDSASSVHAAEDSEIASSFNSQDSSERARRIEAHFAAQAALRNAFSSPPGPERSRILEENQARLISSRFRIDTTSKYIFPRSAK